MGAGIDMIVKVGDGAATETFNNIGGLNSTGIQLSAELIDTTNKDSARVRQLLEGGGTKSWSTSGDGESKASNKALLQGIYNDWKAGVNRNFQIDVPDFGTFTGPFQIESMDLTGETSGSIKYSISLQNADDIAFVAA